MEKKIEVNIPDKIKEIIAALIISGNDLVDGAETCGHDDCVDDWNKTKKKALKIIGGEKALNEINKKNHDNYLKAEEEKHKIADSKKALSVDEFFNL